MRGYLLVVGISLFWGFNWPMMKIALMEIPPWTFRTLVLVCAAGCILALAKARGHKLSIPKAEFWPLVAVSMLNVTGWHLCSAYGIGLMQAGRAVIVAFTMPLWASILSSMILKEKLSVRRFCGLFFGLAGLFILIQPQLAALDKTPLGVVFMLAAALSWGFGTVLLKFFRWTMPVILLTGWQLTIGSVPVVIGASMIEPVLKISQLSLRAELAVLYVILFPMIFCQWAYFSLVGIFPAGVAAISTMAVPVIGVFSSALVLGEPLGVREAAALLLVVSALGIVLLGANRSA